MSERIYSYDHVDAAMCIWEEMTNPVLPDAPTPWKAYREQWGAAGLRDVVIEKLAWPCHEAWGRANERYTAEFTVWNNATHEGQRPDGSPPGNPPLDIGSFDWEFVPLWIRECVDWSGDHPRVKGS